MRPAKRIRTLSEMLAPNRTTSVVDIGASGISGAAPYFHLARSGAAEITGFEPDEEALEALNAVKGPNEHYLPHAIGNGKKQTYYATPAVGFASTKKLSAWVGDYFGPLWARQLAEVKEIPMKTKRLDGVKDIEHMDFLKIDIQGGELDVFENAKRLLGNACMVQTEIALLPFYDDQPNFSDIQTELEKHGLIPFCFDGINRARIHSGLARRTKAKMGATQIVDLDVVFVRNPVHLEDYDSEQIKHLAVLAYSVLGALDLVCKCVEILDMRGDVNRRPISAFLEAEHPAE